MCTFAISVDRAVIIYSNTPVHIMHRRFTVDIKYVCMDALVNEMSLTSPLLFILIPTASLTATVQRILLLDGLESLLILPALVSWSECCEVWQVFGGLHHSLQGPSFCP